MVEIASKYVLLETYRRDGSPVRTPVWFVKRDGGMLVITRDKTGKVRRLRNDSRVRLAACGMRGAVRGEWADGTARIAPEMTGEAMSRRNKRYGFVSRLAVVASRGRGKLVALDITFR